MFYYEIKISSSCEYSSMLTSSISDILRNSNYSLNLIISLGPIPCLHFVTRIIYIWKVMIEKLQCQTEVYQEMAAMNYLQIPNLHALFGWTKKNSFFVW